MDGDVIPLTSLDYWFRMSEGPEAILKPNVFMATHNEPAQGGFFMIEPNLEAGEQIFQLIADHGDTVGAKARWDKVKGWGHTIDPADKWETNNPSKQGQNWDWVSHLLILFVG